MNPDFENMKYRCPACKQERLDKFIRVQIMDVGHIFNFDPGLLFLNMKYCSDIPTCKLKATDMEWVVKNFFPEKQNELFRNNNMDG